MIRLLQILTLIYIHYTWFKNKQMKNRRNMYGSRIYGVKRLYGYKVCGAVHIRIQIDFSKVIKIFLFVHEHLGCDLKIIASMTHISDLLCILAYLLIW